MKISAEEENRRELKRIKKILDIPNQKFVITVDHSLGLEEMISAGRYDIIRGPVAENPVKNFFSLFSLGEKTGTETVTVEVYQPEAGTPTEGIVRRLKRLGFRPATFRELLAFGAQFPQVQEHYNIRALGSLTRIAGSRYAPEIGGEMISNNRRKKRFLDGSDHCLLQGQTFFGIISLLVVREKELSLEE